MKTRNRWLALAILGFIASAISMPALAHVTANPNRAEPGGFALVEFRVSHGCEESPTVEVAIQIPEAVVSVTPEVMDGWAIELVREGSQAQTEEPPASGGSGDEGHGSGGDDGRVTEVRWTGSLPADRVDHFGLSMRFADDVDARSVTFPTRQRCEVGELGWIEVPPEGEDVVEFFDAADSPAPYVLLEADGSADAAGAGTDGATEDVDADGLATEREGAGESDTLAVVALVAALLGILLAAAALVRAGAARPPGTDHR